MVAADAIADAPEISRAGQNCNRAHTYALALLRFKASTSMCEADAGTTGWQSMATIGIVYFSGYGHTKKQAEAVAAGARKVAGATVSVFAIDKNGDLPEGSWDILAGQDAIIYGSPTYMGGPAWQFKKFADASSKQWFANAWKDKIAAGFTNSASVNGDKFSTISYFFTLSQQHGQIWIGTGLMPSNAKKHGPNDINWTAGFAGALAVSPSDASPDEAPGSGDLETAKLLGKRVAEYAVKTSADVSKVAGFGRAQISA